MTLLDEDMADLEYTEADMQRTIAEERERLLHNAQHLPSFDPTLLGVHDPEVDMVAAEHKAGGWVRRSDVLKLFEENA